MDVDFFQITSSPLRIEAMLQLNSARSTSQAHLLKRFARCLGAVASCIVVLNWDASLLLAADTTSPGWLQSNLPGVALFTGIATILITMVAFRFHAFMALILAALAVSCFVPGEGAEYILRVASDFGKSCGGIGIVIAMATIIGKAMLDSGSADRVVQAFTAVLGQKRAPQALMGSAFLLGIPVFFDTVFYLLVPLARSFYQHSKKNYVRYLLAIAAGGAVTHTMVPPTPGPLFIAANLNVNLGLMIVVGMLVGFPTALAGLIYAWYCDLRMPIEMRQVGMSSATEPKLPKRPPNLMMALMPVALPVLLISIATVLGLLADNEAASKLRASNVKWEAMRLALQKAASQTAGSPFERLRQAKGMTSETWTALTGVNQLSEAQKESALSDLNAVLSDKSFYDAKSFSEIALSPETQKALINIGSRQRLAELQHMNRGLLDDLFRESISPQQWFTPMRKAAIWAGLPGDPNMALIIAALVSLWILRYTQQRTFAQLSEDMEEALLSGATIILITAAGGAFGEILRQVNINQWVQGFVPNDVSGITILFIAFLVSAVLKIAQGSSTVAMIVASSTLGAIIDPADLKFNMVYVATSIASGSLFGSWMNDSGFWVFAKMGGLSEKETLRSWTVLLIVLSFVGFSVSATLAYTLPLK
jgi:H+/gluconate symporter-like permease